MKNLKTLIFLLLISSPQIIFSQKTKTDANIFGHVICTNCDEHLSFANIQVKGTTIGITTDETGHYHLINLPEGKHTLIASYVGYKPMEKEISIKKGESKELNFELIKDALGLEEVVISSDRTEQKRTKAPVIVNTISSEIFQSTQSVSLGEGLNFSPGLRLENNCQNCGFSQVRMNGMEGNYSQILINSRPIFSGLAGVYGLELIPATMIERVEVVRGGGSALFGSNAIAGTINIILKEPKSNSYEAGANYSLAGVGMNENAEPALEYSLNFNTSVISDDHKSGMSLFGFTRKREIFDANNDSYSEIAPLENITFGARAFHRFGYRDKLSIDFFAINEQRDGGNKQDYPLHERDIAESVKHNMKVAGISYDRFFREYDLLSIYASGQFLDRKAYYGAGKSLSSYGQTGDFTYNTGIQYKALLGKATIIGGFESTGGFLLDKKLGYPDVKNAGINYEDSTILITHEENTVIADQSSISTGFFAQYELKLDKFRALAGIRFDHFEIKDLALNESSPKTGNVISPRLSIMYEVFKDMQARISYSQGYRAPQIFDEDLHIESSAARQVIHRNNASLKQETSHSFMASVDYNGLIGTVYSGFLLEGFYTRLDDAFANQIGDPEVDGTVVYTRINAEGGALVSGINIELKLKLLQDIEMVSGFTIQTSQYDTPEEKFNETSFFRTPDQYGDLHQIFVEHDSPGNS